MSALHSLHDALINALGGGAMAALLIDMHWMLASFWLCMLCLALHAAVSKFTPEPLTEEKAALVWKTPLEALDCAGWRGLGNYKFLSALLFILLASIYLLLA